MLAFAGYLTTSITLGIRKDAIGRVRGDGAFDRPISWDKCYSRLVLAAGTRIVIEAIYGQGVRRATMKSPDSTSQFEQLAGRMNGAMETAGDQTRASVRGIEQIILARIARAEYPSGQRLPSCEQLGRQLGANKNTVGKAYQDLARQGYLVSTPGRGTFVTHNTTNSFGEMGPQEVTKLLAEAITRARDIGMSVDELETLALEAIRLHFNRVGTRIGYVDCNRSEARDLARDLASSLSAAVEPLVVSDVMSEVNWDQFDLLAVNISHLRSVELRLHRGGGTGRTEIIPMVALPNADTLSKVAALAAGTRLLVLSDTEEILHTLAGLARGVNPAIHVSEFLSSSVLLNDVLESADAILVTRTAQRRLSAAFSASATVIVASFRLDGQSIAEVAKRRAAREQIGRGAQGEPEATGPRD
jgi:GntR family transcriptional regulator